MRNADGERLGRPWNHHGSARLGTAAYPPSSPTVVRGCRSNTRESPARAAGLRGGLVQRAASSLLPNELCELPAGFSSGWLRTAAQAALDRRFGSHQLQFHRVRLETARLTTVARGSTCQTTSRPSPG